jgi:hypothetical protein
MFWTIVPGKTQNGKTGAADLKFFLFAAAGKI